ncbi:DUF3891 family protein [Paenibacillus albicereus]|uniref:DUF3891 family protein n=1 Tax=Paenibacillus albicereus TaxID=2726185 RepID=A0A6H2GW34_9BACL|nr:DUF3891 family protein [Paenibacillus albicereus]QJC51617.1 DUF3891 family protein [Paenibacillus albicereus]
MIVRDGGDSFVLIRQHDHAAVSEQLARALAPELLPPDSLRAGVVYAAAQHDRGWIELDETPIWNDAAGRPYAFEDYPLLPKIAYYRRGIDEVEAVSPYSALLCSLFYQAFFESLEGEACEAFRSAEQVRQRRLMMNLRADPERTRLDLLRLQLLDSLSLYVCLNEPGAAGRDEHPWYREGFPAADGLLPHGRRLRASWIDEQRLLLSEKALLGETKVELRLKRVPKARIAAVGIDEACRASELETVELVWRNPPV